MHRGTVYRRWRGVGGLLVDLVDLVDAVGEIDWPPQGTGSLREDLTPHQEIQESLSYSRRSLSPDGSERRRVRLRITAGCVTRKGRLVEAPDCAPPPDAPYRPAPPGG
ncbi:hypothetical protein [Streptomyces humidus]|uniref:hypothetical protein n=1 Tax=Streptomyces humidus TaxID=52259 RepID=UPI003D9F3616